MAAAQATVGFETCELVNYQDVLDYVSDGWEIACISVDVADGIAPVESLVVYHLVRQLKG